MQYIGPGHEVVVAPDRRTAAFLRSEGSLNGFHSLHVWDVGGHTVEPVLSLWEADPGSGISFTYQWSHDSKALYISGTTQGFSKKGHQRFRYFGLIYLIDSKQLIETTGIPGTVYSNSA